MSRISKISKIIKRGLLMCVAVLLVISVVPMNAVASGGSTAAGTTTATGNPDDLVVISYNSGRTSITKGTTVDVVLELKHTAFKTENISSADEIDISRLVDSFRGGTVADTQITSVSGSPLRFKTTLKGLTYTGSGNSLKLMVGVKGDPTGYIPLTVPVLETVEYTEPKYEPPAPSTPEPLPAPMALISRSEIDKPLRAKEETTITVYVKNLGYANMQTPVISFTPSDSLILPGASSSFALKDIPNGRTEAVQVRVRATDAVASANQSLTADLKFNYYNRVATVQGTTSDKITIPAETKAKVEDTGIDGPVPNVIINRFDYGGASVAAGENFNLSFRFLNTSSSVNVENLVATVEGGEGFSIVGASNTFYYKKVEAGDEKTVSVPMKAMTTVKNSAMPVEITFKYEYVDNKKRSSVSTPVKISIPVYQPDRFEIAKPTVPEMVFSGEEMAISLNYVNKSKADILNVEASVEGNIETPVRTQNIGNLEPGKSGMISFAVTAFEPGKTDFKIKVSYEDSNGELKTREFPVVTQVQEAEPYTPEEYPEEMPEEGGIPIWVWIGAGTAAVAVTVIIILKKRKKKALSKAASATWDDWDDAEIKSESKAEGEKNEL